MLGGEAGSVPAVRVYALRSLRACPTEQVSHATCGPEAAFQLHA
jgi:hypothetical protein